MTTLAGIDTAAEAAIAPADEARSPVAVEALGSGKFSTREGQEKVYTQKLDVNYVQNKRQTISFDWKQNTNSDYLTILIAILFQPGLPGRYLALISVQPPVSLP